MTGPVHILNGPNLNLLGEREPAVYGTATLAEVEALCRDTARALGLAICFRQTNGEGALVDMVHDARSTACGIIINAGAYTHTSLALGDALLAVPVPILEVHLSNPFAREPMRHRSCVAPAARGVICGFGPQGYAMALEALARLLPRPPQRTQATDATRATDT